MENLKITLVQPNIIWEDASANLEKYTEMLSGIKGIKLPLSEAEYARNLYWVYGILRLSF